MIAAPLVPSPCPAGNVGSGGGCRWLRSAIETAALASGNWPLTPDPAPWQWTCFPKVAIRTPGTDTTAVPAARDFASATVQRWGAAERSGDVAVVVSARPHRVIQLGLAQPGPCVLCAVADPSRKPPVLKYPGALDETGRGLHLVGAFSDNWGYTALGDPGKAVWAIFSTAPWPACPGSGEPR